MNTIEAILSAPFAAARKVVLVKAAFEQADDQTAIALWDECSVERAEQMGELLKEKELETLEERVEKARANLAQAAEAQAKAAKELAEQAEITPREAAARQIEAMDFEGADEIALALRGGGILERTGEDMTPYKGAKTLEAALAFPKVPGVLKKDGGPIRTALAAAWAAHSATQKARREAFKALPAKALAAFKEFQMELTRATKLGIGFASDQQIRGAALPFFKSADGLPPLVKTLEGLIQAKEPNPVNELLRNDPELAATVANADEGRHAGALINALQSRAREDAKKTLRRKCGGKFGSNPYGQGKSRR